VSFSFQLYVADQLRRIIRLHHELNAKVETIMATQTELAAELAAVTAKVAKIGLETATTLDKVVELEGALVAGGNTSPAVDEALTALKAQVQLVDDLIPDAPV
jgi:hypothetical protein